MKAPSLLSWFIGILLMFGTVSQCDYQIVKVRRCIAGRIVDHKGAPIANVKIFQGRSKKPVAETGKDGGYTLCIPKDKKVVLNFHKLGYGLASKVYNRESANEEVTPPERAAEEEAMPWTSEAPVVVEDAVVEGEEVVEEEEVEEEVEVIEEEEVAEEPVVEVVEVEMTEATVVEVDPAATPDPDVLPEPPLPGSPLPVPTPEPAEATQTITDETPDISTPPSADIPPTISPLALVPFVVNANGQLTGFRAPADVATQWAAYSDFAVPTIGASVQLDPSNLEETAEEVDVVMAGFSLFQNPQESANRKNITASISTVDLYGRDGMPGDYIVRDPNGRLGTMYSYGAVDVSFYRNGKVMKLKEGKTAIITIPVDTMAILTEAKLKPIVPLLKYNPLSGNWEKDTNGKKVNYAVLNKTRTAYVARVTHFSTFNVDFRSEEHTSELQSQ